MEMKHDSETHHHEMSHEDHQMMIQDFKKRFWISTLLTLPVLIFSPMIQMFLGFSWSFPYMLQISFLLSSIIYLYGGWPFLTGLFNELKNKNPGMMTLIGLAISIAYFYSAAIVFGLRGSEFFWELATLIDIMLLGHWIEMKSILGASRSLESLVKTMPSEAHRVTGDHIEDIKLNAIRVGDILLIKPGEKIPADGILIEGESYVNESMLTGESKPVKKTPTSAVIGGSINGNGSLKVQVKHTGKEAYLSKVIQLVQEAQKTKSKTQRLADKAARWLAFIAIGGGIITLGAWIESGYAFAFALERMVTVMVISCPHALGLAIPLVVAISTSLSAQHGLLIRNRVAFEDSRKITLLVFDKTGTLTQGKFGITHYESLSPHYSKEDILKLACALEQHSEHPIAAGFQMAAKDLHLSLPRIENFQAIPGKGIAAFVENQHIQAVSAGFLKEKNISIPEKILSNAAATFVFVFVNDALVGFIALADQIRPESFEAIKTLKQHHIRLMMITGDNKIIAKSVSDTLGLDGFYAEVLPHQKLEIIKTLQAQGEFVAMTGDGVNDAPALAQADIGIAIGSGTDVACETADIILVESNPKDIATLILFGKATYQKMLQNLIWATGYNAVALPLAAGVLYHSSGWLLNPAVGAVLMSLSTIIVAINAQLLKNKL